MKVKHYFTQVNYLQVQVNNVILMKEDKSLQDLNH